jgi:DNA-binding transcriptional ArsR family regulator
MTKIQDPPNLDNVFEALASKHRRGIIHVLSLQPCSISQLAAMHSLSLPAIYKHIKVLEQGDMIIRKKIGRTHYLALKRKTLQGLQDWLMQYQTYWGNDEATLKNYAEYLGRKPTQHKEKQ